MDKTLYSLRMSQAELDAMNAAARSIGETSSEYVRTSIRMRTSTLAVEKVQSAMLIGFPSTWTIVSPAPVPTHNTGCLVNVDWIRA